MGCCLMDMETVKLATIVERLAPELGKYLTPQELDTQIVLRDGITRLDATDVMEILQFSICRKQQALH